MSSAELLQSLHEQLDFVGKTRPMQNTNAKESSYLVNFVDHVFHRIWRQSILA